jgi:Transposase DDE domain
MVSKGGVAKNRKVIFKSESEVENSFRLDELAKSLSEENFKPVILNLDKPKTVWVSTFSASISHLEKERNFAIVMNANSFEEATDVDYFITNVDPSIVTSEWIVMTYSQRNWVEVFYREAKGWLGLKEYQVRDKKSLLRHFILVFCAYTFMRTRILRKPQNREMSVLWHKLTGGLQRRWANKSLNTFDD